MSSVATKVRVEASADNDESDDDDERPQEFEDDDNDDDDDDDDDGEDDNDDDEDEEDNDDDESSDNCRTPTNELVGSAPCDDFKWVVRSSPIMLKCLAHEDLEQQHQSKGISTAGNKRSAGGLSSTRAAMSGGHRQFNSESPLRPCSEGLRSSQSEIQEASKITSEVVVRSGQNKNARKCPCPCRCPGATTIEHEIPPPPPPPPSNSRSRRHHRNHRHSENDNKKDDDDDDADLTPITSTSGSMSPSIDLLRCYHTYSSSELHSRSRRQASDGGRGNVALDESRVRARSQTRPPSTRVSNLTYAERRHDSSTSRVRPRSVCSVGSCASSAYGHCRDLALEYMQWRNFFKANGLSPDSDDLQDKVQRLECDKENLALQVSVLNEQIQAQTDKIRDLESALDTKKGQLENVEDMLQHGLMALESQKLDLMAEISNLKLRMTSIEKDKLDIEERYRRAELEVIGLKTTVSERDREILSLKSQVAGRSQPPGMMSSPDVTKSSYHVSPENSLRKVQQRYLEMDKLRKALECVMAANDEKDRRIDELEHAVSRYKNVQERVLTSHFRKSNSVTTEEEDVNEGIPPPPTPPPSQSPIEFNSKYKIIVDHRVTDKPPSAPRAYFARTEAALTASASSAAAAPRGQSTQTCVKSPPGAQRATSFEEIATVPPTTPPSHVRHGVESYGTIPRKQSSNFTNNNNNNNNNNENNNAACLSSKDVTYRNANNPDLDPFRSHSRQKSSGMSFGPTESSNDSNPPIAVPRSPQVLDSRQKPKGIKRIFGKLKRSNSQHLEDAPGEFRRGGVRSTAGPRLAWSRELKVDRQSGDLPFVRWDGERIASWLHDIGLTAYIGDCKRWVKTGDQMLRATSHDLEKELGIKHPLHRKKLQLALQAVGDPVNVVADEDAIGALDYVWVTRWLDDVGLPQYKDTFSESRIDGRVLNVMTVEDLLLLKVTNLLHYASLRRGIQVLRDNNFNPNCLKRRPGSDENGNPSSSPDVVLWTNHRVMEWLRLVDLSEYAPNLRGSGVHGALMIFEPRFNAELLATLLSIPLSKTLLRRHLSTHFKQLVGPDIMKQKREHEASSLYVPITPGIKIKPTRRSQFSLMKKRNKNDLEYEDYVCPHDLPINGNSKQDSKIESAKDGKSKVRPTNSNPVLSTASFSDKHL